MIFQTQHFSFLPLVFLHDCSGLRLWLCLKYIRHLKQQLISKHSTTKVTPKTEKFTMNLKKALLFPTDKEVFQCLAGHYCWHHSPGTTAGNFSYIYYTTYYILHTTYYILHTTYYILHTTYYILHTTYYILHTTIYYCG